MSNIIINNKSYKENGTEFFLVDNRIQKCIAELGLGLPELSVYMFYIRCQNNKQQARPSMEYILKETPIKSKETVRKAIRNLEKVGLLIQLEKGHSGKASVYQVNYCYMNKEDVQGEPQKASESILYIEDIKPLPQQKKQPQKARNKKYNGMDSDAVIPFKRGVHNEIVTSKEAKERLNYYESDEYKAQAQADEEAIERLFGL